jgi:hypothetical protein
MVWKSKKAKDPIDRNFFPSRSIRRQSRSINEETRKGHFGARVDDTIKLSIFFDEMRS